MTFSGQAFLDAAKRFLGDPYVRGGAGPSDFDCSGLVQYALHLIGVSAPRTSEAQWNWVKKIQASDLQVGDLVFSQWPGDDASPGHVAIYAGGGQTLEASYSGVPVHFVPLDANYKAHVVGYGRVPGSSGGGSGGGLAGAVGSAIGLALPSGVDAAFSSAADALKAMMWILNPENWARILAGVFGLLFAAFGVGFLLWAAA